MLLTVLSKKKYSSQDLHRLMKRNFHRDSSMIQNSIQIKVLEKQSEKNKRESSTHMR